MPLIHYLMKHHPCPHLFLPPSPPLSHSSFKWKKYLFFVPAISALNVWLVSPRKRTTRRLQWQFVSFVSRLNSVPQLSFKRFWGTLSEIILSILWGFFSLFKDASRIFNIRRKVYLEINKAVKESWRISTENRSIKVVADVWQNRV